MSVMCASCAYRDGCDGRALPRVLGHASLVRLGREDRPVVVAVHYCNGDVRVAGETIGRARLCRRHLATRRNA